jgi:hypothetical protein
MSKLVKVKYKKEKGGEKATLVMHIFKSKSVTGRKKWFMTKKEDYNTRYYATAKSAVKSFIKSGFSSILEGGK